MYLCIARRMVLTGSHAAMKLCLSHVVIAQPSAVGKSVLECADLDSIVLTLSKRWVVCLHLTCLALFLSCVNIYVSFNILLTLLGRTDVHCQAVATV